MRIGWIVLALLMTRTNGAAADVTAYISTDSPVCTYAAKQIASSVFHKAGVDLEWKSRKPARAGGEACLLVQLVADSPAEYRPGALAVSYPFGGCSKKITVFLDRVRSLAGSADREAAVLAYVLVHEITHVIQGVDRHSDAGVMKAHWTASDRDAMAEERLGFLDHDVLLIRRGLDLGWRLKRTAFRLPSESGSASRQE